MMIVILVVHVLLAVALIAVVLIQKSEGGGLGLGGGGGMSGFMTGRSTANLLTRTTAVLAACFMGTSIALAIMAARQHSPSGSILDQIPVESAPPPSTQPATPSGPAKPAPPAEPTVPLAK